MNKSKKMLKSINDILFSIEIIDTQLMNLQRPRIIRFSRNFTLGLIILSDIAFKSFVIYKLFTIC